MKLTEREERIAMLSLLIAVEFFRERPDWATRGDGPEPLATMLYRRTFLATDDDDAVFDSALESVAPVVEKAHLLRKIVEGIC